MNVKVSLPLLLAGLLVAAACTGTDDDPAAGHQEAHGLRLVDVPPVDEPAGDLLPSAEPSSDDGATAAGDGVAVIGEHGHLGSLTDPSVADAWHKWRARVSHDGTTVVMTLDDKISRTSVSDETLISWVTMPDAAEDGQLTLDEPAHLDAVSRNGDFVALTNFAAPLRKGEIAGAKTATTLRIADRDGVRYKTELDGNFVVEAFGRRVGADGLPGQLFLIEHIPAYAPQFYRVRVLDTATGDVSLPLNIRDKSQQVDERMSGFSRSQVIADEHGLLFTLYRGTLDGTPDGEPYAFVHTLDLADGVWCLFLDPELELDRLPGSIAVGGDRLYVASANGKIGSIPIPAISDVNRNPEMDWVVAAGDAGSQPPILLGADDGVWVGYDDGSDVITHIDPDGEADRRAIVDGFRPTALAWVDDSRVIAAGDGWSTLGDPDLPDWFGDPVALYPA